VYLTEAKDVVGLSLFGSVGGYSVLDKGKIKRINYKDLNNVRALIRLVVFKD